MYNEPAYRWADPIWREAAEAWIHEIVAQGGNAVTGPINGIRFLPWSAVLRAPTTDGEVYFKACGPSQRHEPLLASFLAATRPDCMISVLATDTTHGWCLMPDGGPTLAGIIHEPPGELGHWSRVLRLQAAVQRQLASAAGRLLQDGVPDRRPAALTELLEPLLERPDLLLAGHPGAMTRGDIARLQGMLPQLADLALELAAIGPPDTFVHDDFHEDHIFATARPDRTWRYVFFDFGDACISHPFVQLVSQPRFAGNRFGVDVDPIQNRLREVYLAEWLDFAPHVMLDRALALALIIGCVARALTWINACQGHLDVLPPHLLHAYGTRVAFWLRQIGERIGRLDDN